MHYAANIRVRIASALQYAGQLLQIYNRSRPDGLCSVPNPPSRSLPIAMRRACPPVGRYDSYCRRRFPSGPRISVLLTVHSKSRSSKLDSFTPTFRIQDSNDVDSSSIQFAVADAGSTAPEIFPSRSVFMRASPPCPAASKNTAARIGVTPAMRIAGPKCFCGPMISPVISGAVTPAPTATVFKYPIVRATIALGDTCCEIVQ